MKIPILLTPVIFLASCSLIPRPLGYSGGEASYGRVAVDYSKGENTPTLQFIFADQNGKSVARYHIKEKDVGYDYSDFANARYANGQMHLDLLNGSRVKVGELTVDAKNGMVSKKP